MSTSDMCADSPVAYKEPSWLMYKWWKVKRLFEKKKESNFLIHAKREFLAAGYTPLDQKQGDGPNKWMQENVLALLTLFAKQGHSGFSASYCIEAFKTLAKFEPLLPLQGTDAEWNECGDGVFQNRRCSHVFKQADRFNGQAYDINGKIFKDPDGFTYTNSDSSVPITFPYTPKHEYVDVPAEGESK